MMRFERLARVLAFCFSLSIAFNTQATSALKGLGGHEYDLFTHLFQNYSKSIRPVNSWTDTLKVNVMIQLKKIAKVIENHQTMKIYVRMELIWPDVNLVWNPSDYNHIKSIIVPASNVWIPDLHLFNSATEDDLIYPMNVEIFANGTVQSSPLTTLYAHCDYNFKYFPYDTQSCEFIIGTMLDKVSVRVHAFMPEINRFQPNAEWKLTSMTEGETHAFLIPGTSHAVAEAFNYNWSAAKFQITIKRDANFYVHLFIWPLVFVLVLGTSMFILPPSCVERISMGILLILTLVVSSLMLDSFTPKSADSSVIGKLIAFDMFMVTLATVVSTLIITIDKENFLMVRKIPQWVISLMLKYIGKMAFKQETLNRIFNEELVRSIDEDDDMKVIETNQILEQTDEQVAGASAVSEQVQTDALLTLINNQIAMFRRKLKENDVKDVNKQEWYLIATVLDRVCLLTYSLIAAFGLFVILI